ncbi:MAG: FliH/SctL family protein [Steroidobacteraceae bacterium]|nr:FliH/SctL family protein [Steroidobacteraceae bacterium]MDW8260099.1 FliH/SctL family protein [Gammaproteobacteria bacterium]
MSERSASAWALPQVLGPVVSGRGRSASAEQVAGETDAARMRAFEEERLRGYNLGIAQADALRAELRAKVDAVDRLLQQAARPLRAMDHEVEAEMAALALAIGKQLARRELRIDPTQVAAIVRETVALLPIGARQVRVTLHPEDAAVLRAALAPAGSDRAWELLEDPVMTRGGCRIDSEFSRIDARFESRVAQIAARLLDVSVGEP